MKKQKKLFISAVMLFLFVFFGTTIAKAQNYGLDTAANEAKLPAVKSLPTYAGNLIGAGLAMVSIVFFVLMLYAGIRWMIARGNEEQETKAKDTIIAAVIGMVIIMASYALTNFVFKGSTGGNVPNKKPSTVAPSQLTAPLKSGVGTAPKCTVKAGVTKICQENIMNKWFEIYPAQNGVDFLILFIDPEFKKLMNDECAKGDFEAICEIPSNLGYCVSMGGTYCQSANQLNNETNCKEASEICEWK